MKKFVFLIVAGIMFGLFQGKAQTIITDDSLYISGQPAAVLDIKSDSKGILIPRLDYNNRPSANLVTGLLIYVTANGPQGNNAYYYYDGLVWVKLAIGLGSQWVSIGSDIYFNSGKVGIGTVSPGSELDVKGTLRLSGIGSGYVGLKSPVTPVSYTLTLPGTVGLSGQFLTTTGGGDLGWTTLSIATITALQDSLNDRYRRKDTATVLLSRTRATLEYAPISHNQGISTVTGLQDSLSNRYRRADTTSVLLSKTRASHDYETKISTGTTSQYWRGDKSWQTLGITTVPALQDSLNDRYRRKDTATVLLSRTRATHDYAPISHNQGISTVTGLQDSLTNRYRRVDTSSVLLSRTRATHDYAPISHNQGISTVTGLQDSLSNRYRRADTASVLLSKTRASHDYETKINTGTTSQYWRGDKTWQTLGITTVPALQDSLNDRYRRKDTATVLLSRTRATHDYAPISHNQGISTINNLQDSLNNRYRRADTSFVLLSRTRASHDYETKISTGTTSQFWRGDKTWQTLGITTVPALQDSLNDRYRRKDTATVLLSRTRATHDYAPISHNQGISTVTGLQDSLTNRYRRADTSSVLLSRTRATHDYAPISHNQGISTVTGLQDSLTNRYRRVDTSSVLLSRTRATHDYAPISHNQGISTVTGLQDSLSNRYRRADTASVLLSKTRASHDYETKINSGTTSQYWRGDKTWQSLGITTIPALQDSLNDRYRRKDTATVLLSRIRATHDYAPISHNQGISTVTGLQDSLSNRYRRADTASVLLSKTRATHDYAPISHNQGISTVTGLQDSLSNRYRRADTTSVLLSKTRASHDYETKISTGTTSQYWRGDKSWQTLGITTVPALQDSLNDRYRRKDTATVLLSRIRATHDYAPISHNQGISTVTGLQDSLTNRYRRVDTSSVLLSRTRATHDYAPISHNQGISTVTGLQDSLSNRYRRADTTSVLLSKTRASHDYETKINSGTTSQYWRGDKSWQTLGITTVPALQDSLNDRYRRNDTANVLLSRIRANHDYAPLSHTQEISTINGLEALITDFGIALNLKANLASPEFTGVPLAPTATAGTSTSQIATTEFVTSAITTATPDASSTVKGKIKLAGDLTGTADVPVIGNGKITRAKIAGSSVSYAKIQNVSANKLLGRETSGDGVMQEITLGSGLNLSGTTLNVRNDSSWSLHGNSGTIDTLNFIGTTDSVALSFRVNNQKAGRIGVGAVDGTVLLGYEAGLNDSTAKFNTIIGYRAGVNLNSNNNTLIGKEAGSSMTSGIRSTAVGVNALQYNRTGDNNTALGYGADVTKRGLNNSTAIGYNAKVDQDNKVQIGNNNISIVTLGDGLSSNLETGSLSTNSIYTSSVSTNSMVTYNLQIVDGNQASGRVLTSDDWGNVSWQDAPGGVDATTLIKGKIQLAGDLGGSGTTASAPVISKNAITTEKISAASVTYEKIQNVSSNNKVLGRVSGGAGMVEEIATTGTGNVVRAESPTFTGAVTAENQSLSGTLVVLGQTAIGNDSAAECAALDVNSTAQGFLPPRLTYAQKISIPSPVAGLIIWCSNCGSYGEVQVFNGTVWTNMCGSPASAALPTLAPTTAPISVTLTTASSGGNVTSDGGASVTARGVCWSTSTGPTVALGTKTVDGSGTGSFTSTLTGLTAGTLYYVRSYATNTTGTAYGTEVSFTEGLPILNPTTAVTDITATTATSGGNVTSDGGAAVTVRGVCWSTSSGPTISNSHTTDGSGTGSFSSSLTGLTSGTLYYVRSYATNSAGTSYGSEVSFTTSSIITSLTFTNGGSRPYVDLEDGASISVNNIVYCFGGYQNHSAGAPDLWTYTLATDTWTQKASLPPEDGRTEVPLAYNSTDGKIYTFGGNIDWRDYNNLNRYDIGTNTWEQVCTHVPGISERRGCSMGILNNKVYIIGGWEDTPGYLTDSYCYDLGTGTTTSIASLPIPTAWGSMSCQLGNYVYIAGGNNNTGTLNYLQRYDMSTDSWVQLADMPEARASSGNPLLYYNGSLWILSGGNQTTCLRYDISGNSWTTVSSNVTPRSNHWAGISTTGKAMVWGPDNLQTEVCQIP